jgi:hypothetical protein
MSDNPGMPEHDEPSPADLERVRALLAGLGEEPAPPAVVARLERVLESQLPAPGAAPARRRRPWARRAILGALPIAAIVAGALVVSQQSGDDHGSDAQRASGSAEVRSQAAAAAAAPAPLSATDGAGAASAATAADSATPAPDTTAATLQAAPAGTAAAKTAATPEALRQAAIDAYRETRRLLLDRRTP